MDTTSDGYSWSESTGTVKGGLKCRGVVTPARKVTANGTFDVIIVGAGYAGLAAARDLATSRRSVLLLEARDRVGGRTYTVEDEDGFLFELGGTWVTHHFAYLLKEMTRYRMDRDLIMTHHPGYENEYYTISVPGAAPRRMTHEEAGKITAHAWDIFIDIDGKLGRNICPLPHAQLDNVRVARKEVEQVDKLSCKDRLDQIQHLLTLEEKGILSAVLVHISGGTLENSSLWDMIRSQSLLVNSSLNFGDIWTTYKLRQGQSALARAIFDEAIDFGLQYTFNTQVCSISDDKDNNLGSVTVTAANGESFSARRVVCTVPLNVLRTLHFSPPLSPKRQEAISIGHVNFMSKIHAVVDGPGLTSWNGMRLPGHLLFGYGDGITPNGDAHLVGFGADQRTSFVPEEQPEKVVAAFNALHQMKVKKTVFHNWCTDPYSSGGPAWWPPEFMSKYQDELQSSHGSVFFASGDWAHGWRASIDGALEQGSLCGIHVLRELHDADKLVEKVEASRL